MSEIATSCVYFSRPGPSNTARTLELSRARAEALGFTCKVGVLTRLERVFLIALLSAIGLPSVMVWSLAVLSVFTVLQRILHIYAISRRDGGGDAKVN